MVLKSIQTPLAPTPAGHYSQAMVHGETVYVSGLLPVRVGEQPDPTLPFDEQVKVVFTNMKHILEEAGSGLEMVVKVTVYVSDIELWPLFNQLYAGIFGDHKPARVVVPVPELHFGFKLEVEAIAAL